MRKQIGQDNKKARDAAVMVLAGLKGKSIASLKDKEVRDVLTALLQLLGLVTSPAVSNKGEYAS